jgi:hypothetical protein
MRGCGVKSLLKYLASNIPMYARERTAGESNHRKMELDGECAQGDRYGGYGYCMGNSF